MTILRAVASLKHKNGLARDTVTNSFHYEGTNNSTTRSAIIAGVRNLYLGTPTGGIGGPLSRHISAAMSHVDVSIYEVPGVLVDGLEAPVGPPVATTLGTAGEMDTASKVANSTGLPHEVAAVVSYQGTPGPALVQRRRRGRIYFGPLNTAALSAESTYGQARLSQTFRDILAAAFNQFVIAAPDANAEFVVYSRPYAGRDAITRPGRAPLPALPARPAQTVGVDQIWIDDEPDTQRRRGGVRTNRTLITALG